MSSASVDGFDADRRITESPTPFSPAQWDHEIVPKTHHNRTLVLCFDGTGDKFDSDVRKHRHHDHLQPPSTSLPRHVELECCAIYLTTEEGQQARADGLLSGTSPRIARMTGTDILAPKTGIGTYVAKHGSVFFTPIIKKISKLLDEAVAWNLASHTQCLYSIASHPPRYLQALLSAGYEFLMQHCPYF
jgi:hypothetical protein